MSTHPVYHEWCGWRLRDMKNAINKNPAARCRRALNKKAIAKWSPRENVVSIGAIGAFLISFPPHPESISRHDHEIGNGLLKPSWLCGKRQVPIRLAAEEAVERAELFGNDNAEQHPLSGRRRIFLRIRRQAHLFGASQARADRRRRTCRSSGHHVRVPRDEQDVPFGWQFPGDRRNPLIARKRSLERAPTCGCPISFIKICVRKTGFE